MDRYSSRRQHMNETKNMKVVYEDERLIVVDKPGGLLTMSTGRSGETTAYSILYDYLSDRRHHGGRDGKHSIYIVHRLDRDTSGLLLFAKDQQTKLKLQENWNEAVLERKYMAYLEGKIEDQEGWIETWIYENPVSMKVHCHPIDSRDIEAAREGQCRFAERNGWQYASSHCRTVGVMEIDGKTYTKVEFELETGRKNQIRAHSGFIGHPIAGDRKYGASSNPFGRLALHAHKLSFIHPWNGKVLKFTSPLPSALRKGKSR